MLKSTQALKSTPLPVVAVLTNMSYAPLVSRIFGLLHFFLEFSLFQRVAHTILLLQDLVVCTCILVFTIDLYI